MHRRVALVVLAGIAMTVLLVSVSTAGEVRLWHAAPPERPTNYEPPPDTTPPVTTAPPVAPDPADDQIELPKWISVVVQLVALLAAIVLAVLALRALWQRRPRLSWRAASADADFDVLPDIARSLRADAADQRAALAHGAPRNAVVECWLRLEAVVASAGLRRDPADTSTEFTTRVLGAYAVDRSAILELSALYREARFSTHEMGEAERTKAIEALDALHDGLDERMAERAAADV